MRKLILILTLFFCCNLGFGQNPIQIIDVNFQWPDTTVVDSTHSFTITVQNTGLLAYNDSLTFHFYVDSGTGPVFADSMFIGGVMINASDTLSVGATHTFSSARYAPGNNVVVIWPVNGSGELGDSVQLDTYVIYPSEIGDVDLSKYLSVFPNPTEQDLNVVSTFKKPLNYVLFSPYGAIVKQGQLNSASINLADIASGVYHLRLTDGDVSTSIQIIKR